MCPKLKYQHLIGPVPASGEICTVKLQLKPFLPDVHSDQLICLLVANLKTSVIKVTEVSFGIPKDCMLQNPKIILLSIISWKPELS